MSRAQRDFDQQMARLDAELAVSRMKLQIELAGIRAEQNRELWYLAGVAAGLWIRIWIEQRCKR